VYWTTYTLELHLFDSTEINATLSEIMQAYNGVAKWSKTESAPFSVNFAAMKPMIRKEPKGTVLIITPFNFPLWLSLPPVVRIFIQIVWTTYN
jgi:aldehyde dehydrogenase (NAD+)/aldehyde dehydrogenase (NAD(P)+)